MKVTLDQVMGMKPCYTRAQIDELAGGRYSMDHTEIPTLEIPRREVIWVLVHLMTPEQLGIYARRVAQSVEHLWDATQRARWWLVEGDPEHIPTVINDAAWAQGKTCAAARVTVWREALARYIEWAVEELDEHV